MEGRGSAAHTDAAMSLAEVQSFLIIPCCLQVSSPPTYSQWKGPQRQPPWQLCLGCREWDGMGRWGFLQLFAFKRDTEKLSDLAQGHLEN